MDALDIVKAIKHLKPNSEFSFKENDYFTIKWDVLEGEAPTWKEIEEAHNQVKAAEAKLEADKAAAKTAAEAKLAAIGLTSDDLKALGLA